MCVSATEGGERDIVDNATVLAGQKRDSSSVSVVSQQPPRVLRPINSGSVRVACFPRFVHTRHIRFSFVFVPFTFKRLHQNELLLKKNSRRLTRVIKSSRIRMEVLLRCCYGAGSRVRIARSMATALQPAPSHEIDPLSIYLHLCRDRPRELKRLDRTSAATTTGEMVLEDVAGGDLAALTRASELTSPAAVRRLQARKALLQLQDSIPEGFVPPKQLLLYLVRMGSFTSAPKILNDDSQDDEIEIPHSMTREELLNYCSSHLEGTPSLLTRTFANNNTCKDSSLANRNSTVRVLQWNLLSQSLGVNNDNFVCCPEDALAWDRRKHLLVQEIVKYSPDVICLQEVDHFKYLKRTLGSQGYEGMFFPKPDSPCVYIKDNNGPDGCAIFYQADRFELVSKFSRILEVWNVQSNQVAVVAVLRDRGTGLEFAVATTHLKARSGALLAALRNQQGRDLLDFVRDSAGGRPLVLSGDFNAPPSEPVYATLTADPETPLQSAYSAFAGREPPYTTWKIREDGEHCHTIDYIFVSRDRFRVSDVLQFPTGDEVGPYRVPSYSYPSDHFSLCCDLSFVES